MTITTTHRHTALNINTTADLDLYNELAPWPADAPTLQAITIEYDDGDLVSYYWLPDSAPIRASETSDDLTVEGELLTALRSQGRYDLAEQVHNWITTVHHRIDAMAHSVTVATVLDTDVTTAIIAMATDQPVPAQVPGPATDELGILAEAEIVNAMSNESSIRYAQDEDTVRDGTVRGGRWSAEGLPVQGKSIHDAHVRITLSTGMDVFKPFTVLVHMLQTGEAYIHDRD